MNTNTNSAQIEVRLARDAYTYSLYTALAFGVSGLGFVVIYFLTRFGLLGASSPQLLYLGLAVIFFAVFQIPVRLLGRSGKGGAATLLSAALVSLFAVLSVVFLEGITLAATLVVIFTHSRIILSDIPVRYRLALALIKAGGIAGIVLVNQNPLPAMERLEINTPAVVASLAFLAATVVLLITIALISASRRFKSLRGQLLLSSVVIVSIPTIMTAILSAVGGYVNIETQALETLETVSNLKINQLNDLITGFENDISFIQADNEFRTNVLGLFASQETQQGDIDAVRSRLQEIQEAKQIPFEEIMVLDIKGNVLVSTNTASEGVRHQQHLFYRQGYLQPYLGFADESVFGETNLFVSAPIHGQDIKTRHGVLVIRANAQLIKDIVEFTPGYEAAETYLLDKDLHPITKLRVPLEVVRTQASMGASINNVSGSRGIYGNYQGETVLGYYRLFRPLDALFIAELPRAVVIEKSLGTLAASSLLALFAIALAIAAAAITANLTVEPITSLVNTTREFADGNLATRVAIERADEIGVLGNTYNQMAGQIQDSIGQLEKRVADRTRELEDQSRRLRAVAEIAKEASTFTDPLELLKRAGELIQERFNFYHTGIFLLDDTGEYAVLTASPTETGRQMLANGHKLRVGEMGIVGRVAATGGPRVTLDTKLDPLHFNNPLLPGTRSEMALPIKAENLIIGVLDVQSDTPQAFTQEDVASMTIFADQLGVAVERTRLLQQLKTNLDELEKAYGRSSREGWQALIEGGLIKNPGYRFDNVRIQPINTLPDLGAEAMATGSTISKTQKGGRNGNEGVEQDRISVPIKLRGRPIGVVTVKFKEGYSRNTVHAIEQAVERLAGSLESARLFDEARRRAGREQAISHVTTAINSASDFDAILRTTVEEIGKTLGNSEVSIRIAERLE